MDPRGGTKGPPSPDEHPPPSPPVRQGDSASLPSLYHLATSKIPSAPQGAAYLVLLVTWIIDPWFIRMLGINYLSAHSHSLIRLSLVFLFDILDPASVRYMLHRLHHCLSILSSHHHYLSEALTFGHFRIPSSKSSVSSSYSTKQTPDGTGPSVLYQVFYLYVVATPPP